MHLRLYQVTPTASQHCVNPSYFSAYSFFPYPACAPFTRAPCSLGDEGNFINQYDPIAKGVKVGDIRDAWHRAEAAAAFKKAVKKKELYVEEKKLRDAILKVVLDAANIHKLTLPKAWNDYFYKVTILLVPAKLFELKFGVCADAAQHAIVDCRTGIKYSLIG